MATPVNSKINMHSFTQMATFDAVVQNFHFFRDCILIVVEFLGNFGNISAQAEFLSENIDRAKHFGS